VIFAWDEAMTKNRGHFPGTYGVYIEVDDS
jgi:hypothetical protein